MSRVYNFSAGPGALPESVLKKAASELFEYGRSGMSVMEMSHRSKEYITIITETEERLKRLMNIPDSYHVLFLQGGASLQFTMIPMNLMTINRRCDIINTGAWTQKAIIEAKKFGTVNVAGSSGDRTFAYIPSFDKLKLSPDADYVHICCNNTIYGTKYNELPGDRKHPDHRGHVVVHTFRAVQRERLRPDLCGRAEEHRSCGTYDCNYTQRAL